MLNQSLLSEYVNEAKTERNSHINDRSNKTKLDGAATMTARHHKKTMSTFEKENFTFASEAGKKEKTQCS